MIVNKAGPHEKKTTKFLGKVNKNSTKLFSSPAKKKKKCKATEYFISKMSYREDWKQELNNGVGKIRDNAINYLETGAEYSWHKTEIREDVTKALY